KQYQKAQHGDVEQLIGPYLLEIKNQARLSIGAWWDQARAAAVARGGCLPCVAYRLPNRGLYDRWRFVVPDERNPRHAWGLDYRYAADLGLDALAVRGRGRVGGGGGVRAGGRDRAPVRGGLGRRRGLARRGRAPRPAAGVRCGGVDCREPAQSTPVGLRHP